MQPVTLGRSLTAVACACVAGHCEFEACHYSGTCSKEGAGGDEGHSRLGALLAPLCFRSHQASRAGEAERHYVCCLQIPVGLSTDADLVPLWEHR